VAIGEERARVKAELEAQGPLLEAGAALITAALDLLDNPQELYRQTTDPVRRQLNQVFFDKLYLDTDEVTDDRLSEPFNDFLYPRSLLRQRAIHTRPRRIGTKSGATWGDAERMSAGAALLDRIARGEGSSQATMVELRGLEPLTSSMPWWPDRRTRRAASVYEGHTRVGAATVVQLRSPPVCPPRFEWRSLSVGWLCVMILVGGLIVDGIAISY
jgi:hypothetical protein